MRESDEILWDNGKGEGPDTGPVTTHLPGTAASIKGTDKEEPIFAVQGGMAGIEYARSADFGDHSFFAVFRVARKIASPIPNTTPPAQIEKT